jgi:hypothetical protein
LELDWVEQLPPTVFGQPHILANLIADDIDIAVQIGTIRQYVGPKTVHSGAVGC